MPGKQRPGGAKAPPGLCLPGEADAVLALRWTIAPPGLTFYRHICYNFIEPVPRYSGWHEAYLGRR